MQDSASSCCATRCHSCRHCRRPPWHTTARYPSRWEERCGAFSWLPTGGAEDCRHRDISRCAPHPHRYTGWSCCNGRSTSVSVRHSLQPCYLFPNTTAAHNSPSIPSRPITGYRHRADHNSASHWYDCRWDHSSCCGRCRRARYPPLPTV